MQISFSDEVTPHIQLKNVFDQKTLDEVYLELDYLSKFFRSEEQTGPATADNGKILKKNKGIFLNEVYTSPKYSAISNFLIQNIFCIDLDKNCNLHWKPDWLHRLWNNCSTCTSLVSYYENADYYEPHVDEAMFTGLIWIWKEPKQFNGGDLLLVDNKNLIKCENNSGIIFLSKEKHAVTPISLKNPGYGRFCISVFLN